MSAQRGARVHLGPQAKTIGLSPGGTEFSLWRIFSQTLKRGSVLAFCPTTLHHQPRPKERMSATYINLRTDYGWAIEIPAPLRCTRAGGYPLISCANP